MFGNHSTPNTPTRTYLVVLLPQHKQLLQIPRGKQAPLPRVAQHPLAEVRFEHLSLIHLLLNRSRQNQAVYYHRAFLPKPPGPFPRLHIRTGVPIGIVQYDSIGTGKVHPQTPHPGGQQETEYLGVGVEVGNEALAVGYCSASVHSVVGEVAGLQEVLDNVQHLLGLGEDEGLVLALVPVGEDAGKDLGRVGGWGGGGWGLGV